ncbi:hypothetical protein HanRHA438_Chr12g0567631 [Helianthus annuus]|nr:hypothetical protein HanHA300_Chr12g0455921 [Helianthus annuus]KAJ0506395.1 hypothetical protein HanHA89_Chr12g0481481 [Helianthus annuus]KAJ0676071.1 hypothetical protein HanLR1_Chr12g0458451 [Helianthus annuus]KAJ0867827.1 hypothetical protein HanRHA438_Chr12g0567631 [Helianthus annuus]
MVLTVGEDGISGLKDTKVFVQINGKIGRLECRGHRNLRCHRSFWMPEDDQAHRRTEHDKDTCFRTFPRRKFLNDKLDHLC